MEPRGVWLPLNSRRITSEYLKVIANTLGLPTSMSAEELRQQIDGKLLDMEHEPRSIQVVKQEAFKTELHLLLVDESGVFLRCGPVFRESQREFEDLDDMRQQQEQMTQQHHDLAAPLEESHRQMEEVCRTQEESRVKIFFPDDGSIQVHQTRV